MRINFLKIDIGGRELLNVKMEKRTTHQYSLPDHWADLTVKSVWNEENLEIVFELCRGAAEIGLKLNVMQDSDKERQPLNP